MPRKAKELTPLEVKRKTRPGLHAVGGVAGLHLQVSSTGSRSWILRAKVGEKRRDIGLGGFPDVALAEAREAARRARQEIRDGIDPVEARKARKAALQAAHAKILTFKEAADLCHAAKSPEFRNQKHRADWINSIKRYANPVIGSMSVADVELAHVISVLKPIWTDRTETATRVRQRIESVLAWATVNGYRDGDNPARWKGNLEHALPKPSKVKKVSHFPALHWSEMGAFMAQLRERNGVAARALEFAILTAARSIEVRGATWEEFDLEAKVWTIPGDRMKAGKPHRVPLSQPALKLLKALPVLEGCPYVFASPRGRQLSDMAMSQITRRMGVKAVPHGFRSTFKDWARSSTGYADEVSELALAHVSTDATRAAYARDELLPKRARLMRDWANFCNTPQNPASVTPIKGAR
jgi:integrase